MEKTKEICNNPTDFINEISLKNSEYRSMEEKRIEKKEDIECILLKLQNEGLFTKTAKQFFDFLYLYYPEKLKKAFIIYGKYRMNKIKKAELCDLANEFLNEFNKYQQISLESFDLLIEINRLRFERAALIRKKKRKK